MHFAWFRSTSLRNFKFVQIKVGELISWGNQFCRISELFGPLFCFLILKFFRSESFVIDSISVHSAWIRKAFFIVLKFLQIKEGGSNFLGEPLSRNVWIIWSPFCISILRVLWTEILRHSLDFSPFFTNEEDFSQSLEICRN